MRVHSDKAQSWRHCNTNDFRSVSAFQHWDPHTRCVKCRCFPLKEFSCFPYLLMSLHSSILWEESWGPGAWQPNNWRQRRAARSWCEAKAPWETRRRWDLFFYILIFFTFSLLFLFTVSIFISIYFSLFLPFLLFLFVLFFTVKWHVFTLL